MAERNGTTQGPDLQAGIPESSLAAGSVLLGHAGERPVMLARVGEQVCALSPRCTHYGGPLDKGITVGATVRCPWHHAAFDLSTGQMVRPPALRALAHYACERRAERIVVGDELTPARPKNVAGPSSVVIVGGGAAGTAAALTLRHEGYAGPITMVSEDTDEPYDRPNCSKDYLAGHAPEEWMPLLPGDFYRDHGIELVLGTRVGRLNRGANTVTLGDGRMLEFDALLIATGAEPRRLSLPGARLEHVSTLRSLADARAIIRRLRDARRVVVIGTSFIGLEVAASVVSRGLAVTVVGIEQQPLGKQLGPQLGRVVQQLHEKQGVTFRLSSEVRDIDAQNVTLASGERLPADVVVVGIGVEPRLELAMQAEIEIDRGILVDELMQTSARGIYAAGDVARYPDPRGSRGTARVEHWVVALRQGQRAAQSMLGRDPDEPIVPFFWSQHYGMTINYVGHSEAWDGVRVHGDLASQDGRVEYLEHERVCAVATVGRDHENLEAELMLEGAGQAP